MTQYARDRMTQGPPPIVADFLTAYDLNAHAVALDKFFAAIPELANLTQKCTAIRNALIRMFTTGPEVPPVEEEEAAVVQGDDTTIIREAEAASRAADEDQSDLEDASSEIHDENVSSEVA